MKQTELRHKQLEQQNRRLLLRVQELELQAKSHGLSVPDPNWVSPSVGILNSFTKIKNEHRRVRKKYLKIFSTKKNVISKKITSQNFIKFR